MASKETLQIEAGATFDSIQFRWLNDDLTPVVLTGWTFKMQIRETPASSLALEIIPTVVDGYITPTMTAVQTATLVLPNYHYAIEATNGATVVRLVEGNVYVSAEVVR